MGIDRALELVLGNLGALFLLVIIIFGGFKRWWVFGWIYDAEVEARRKWEAIATRGLDTTSRAVDVAKSAKR